MTSSVILEQFSHQISSPANFLYNTKGTNKFRQELFRSPFFVQMTPYQHQFPYTEFGLYFPPMVHKLFGLLLPAEKVPDFFFGAPLRG